MYTSEIKETKGKSKVPKCWACNINENKKEVQCGVCRRELETFNLVLLTLDIKGSQCAVRNMTGTIVSAFDLIERNINDIKSIKLAISKDSEIEFYNMVITNPEIIPDPKTLQVNDINNETNNRFVEIIKGIYRRNKGNIVRETKKWHMYQFFLTIMSSELRKLA